MSEEHYSCEDLADSAAELALGTLPGRERAAALAHLEHCPNCQVEVRQLTGVADRLLDLIPGSEPPVGFENRVMEQLSGARVDRFEAHRRRFLGPPRALAVVAALALFLLIGAGGWALGHHSSGGHAPVATANAHLLSTPVTAGGRDVGHAFVYTGAHAWLYVAVQSQVYGEVHCEASYTDGRTALVGTYRLDGASAAWGAVLADGSRGLSKVWLVTPQGTIVGSATFAA